MPIIDFGDIKESEKAIKDTWVEFRKDLELGTLKYNEIEKAKKHTFLKVYNDLFFENEGIKYCTILLSDINKFKMGRGANLRDEKDITYKRFIPNKEYIKDDNRFSPKGIEWLYLVIGNEDEIHLCAEAECRAKKGNRFGFCHFEIEDKYNSLKLIDLTISQNQTYEDINSFLEKYSQSLVKKSTATFLKTGIKTSVNVQKFKEKYTEWGVRTYSKLLSTQIFEPIKETDNRKIMYAPFQTLAQYYISLGYSGIVYGSTVSAVGKNIVLFNKEMAHPTGEIEDYIIK